MDDVSREEALKEELRREYAIRFTGLAEYRKKVWRILTADFFQRWIPADSVVLDLGCGWGEFINQIQAGKKYGMDLNPSSRQHLNPDVIFLNDNCSHPWNLPDNSLDIVFTSNFFEHLREKDHLKATLLQAKRCLRKGGRIICMGPNIRYLAGSYWDFWDHYLALTELSLSELFELTEMKVVSSVPLFLPYTMVKRRFMPMILVKIYLRCPLLWPFFGKQFLVIGEKV